MAINLKEFIARQLNDHSDSQSGVVQKTYTEWSEQHICDAVCLGITYLYSIVPEEFQTLLTEKLSKAACVVDFKSQCKKFGRVVSITNANGDACIPAMEKDANIRSLSSLLTDRCRQTTSGGIDAAPTSYTYDVIDGATGIVKFADVLPKGTTIQYTCGNAPTLNDLDSETLLPYQSMIAEYALWWLFRTDTESRSNLERARLHFEALKFFVTTKMLVEFSLREDDYSFSRRKVDDR